MISYSSIMLLLLILLECISSQEVQGTTKATEIEYFRTSLITTEKQPPIFTSLKEVCIYFRIDPENCTCSSFTMKGTFSDLCSMHNKTEPEVKTLYFSGLSKAYATILMIATIAGFAGNMAIVMIKNKIKSCYREKFIILYYQSVIHAFLAIVQSIKIIPSFWTNQSIYGDFMCKLISWLSDMGSLVTINFIVHLTIFIYVHLKYPLKKDTVSQWWVVLGNIAIALVSSVPTIIFSYVDKKSNTCYTKLPHGDPAYSSFLLIGYFVLPLLFTLCILVEVASTTKKQSNIIRFTSLPPIEEKLTPNNKKSVYHLLVMLSVYALCVGPDRFIRLYLDVSLQHVSFQAYKVLGYSAMIPYGFYISVNPIIHFIYHKKWWLEVRKMTTKLLKTSKNDVISEFEISKKEAVRRTESTTELI